MLEKYLLKKIKAAIPYSNYIDNESYIKLEVKAFIEKTFPEMNKKLDNLIRDIHEYTIKNTEYLDKFSFMEIIPVSDLNTCKIKFVFQKEEFFITCRSVFKTKTFCITLEGYDEFKQAVINYRKHYNLSFNEQKKILKQFEIMISRYIKMAKHLGYLI